MGECFFLTYFLIGAFARIPCSSHSAGDHAVHRSVAQRAKAGWLRRNSAVIPGSLLRGASFTESGKVNPQDFVLAHFNPKVSTSCHIGYMDSIRFYYNIQTQY
jgi:hypothetical protein